MKDFILVFLLLCILSPAVSLLNIKSYSFNGEHDPNNGLDTLQMIRKDGYPAEAHVVQTEDGYLLTMHRIPGILKAPAIFLQHGVLGSSADWVMLGRGKALAYLLADQGYDVWFGNFRGNTYSRAHVSLSDGDPKFWDFSWHESGIYDLPAMITYIVELKEHDLKAYIGFSMGTTCFYVMASERPEITRLLHSVYSLAPVVYMKHVRSPLRYLAPIATHFKTIFYLLGEGEFLPQNYVIKHLAKYLCYVNYLEEEICSNSMFVIVGFDKAQFNGTLLPLILNHTPAGTSSRTLVHYAQEIESGYFRQFDHGAEKNVQIYNSTVPPNYNISNITTPLVLFCGPNDWLSSSILQLIRKNGYPAEAHVVQTEDGYLLTVHRIPGKSGAPAIYVQHGIFGTSAEWVVLGKGKALAYLLADQGYDVWLGNLRGNTYSRAHISLSNSDRKFWDFSWHESGVYDLPAIITYIADLKNDTLTAYIGYSMGTTCFYVMASERPQVVNLLRSAYSLAPVVFMKHLKSPARYLAPFRNTIKRISSLFGKGEILPQNFITKFLAKYFCYFDSIRDKICANLILLAVGIDAPLFNTTLLPTILNHMPAGTSIKTLVHYSQEISSGYFRQYDYGGKKNIEIYNSTEPPSYNLSKIAIPITLIYAQNDWMSSTTDVMRLANELPSEPTMYIIPYKKFNHVDYVWGTDTPRLVYKQLLDMMKK
ncbi:lipase 3-like [Colletes gigas]|uniref:lipase 3-like n=1 Tax=Colletes gigas TaxID=935657 RepID=UPI001C9B6CAA|nr:lipase 3-like [Colletes gigas]XP_043264593.1 lipase 3-like [Colletes gigas]XP_043264594.1 lipase 3-like [Colletes gigas]XP_043264595.1 lipase 3-like [Colletes gigas]XP_043264596.1 lipase 3-like [Colletes gigas]